MTELILNRATFKAGEIGVYGRAFHGTIEATIGNETKTVPAYSQDGFIYAHGFVGRYRTGKKLWNATIMSRIDTTNGRERESVHFGFDSRSGRHARIQDVWFKK